MTNALAENFQEQRFCISVSNEPRFNGVSVETPRVAHFGGASRAILRRRDLLLLVDRDVIHLLTAGIDAFGRDRPGLPVTRYRGRLSGRDLSAFLGNRLHRVRVDARARDRIRIGVVPGHGAVLSVVVRGEFPVSRRAVCQYLIDDDLRARPNGFDLRGRALRTGPGAVLRFREIELPDAHLRIALCERGSRRA